MLAIEPCPAIVAGPGQVILTTVSHLNRDVRELTFKDDDGRTEKVRPTGAHKFYSDDRKNWLSAGDLQVGEYVKAVAGRVQVVSTRRLPGVERVYNLEVEGEHVYYVSRLGALAHNNNCAAPSGGGSASSPPNPNGRNGTPSHQADVATNNGSPNNMKPASVGSRVPDGVAAPGQTVNIRGQDIAPEPGGRVIVESERTVKGGTMPNSAGRDQIRDIRQADPSATIVVTDPDRVSDPPIVHPPGSQPPPKGRLPVGQPPVVAYP